MDVEAVGDARAGAAGSLKLNGGGRRGNGDIAGPDTIGEGGGCSWCRRGTCPSIAKTNIRPVVGEGCSRTGSASPS